MNQVQIENVGTQANVDVAIMIRVTLSDNNVRKIIEVNLKDRVVKEYHVYVNELGKVIGRKLKWETGRLPDYVIESVVRHVLGIKTYDDFRVTLALVAPYMD